MRMIQSLISFLKLPKSTLVYPAHDYNGKKFSTIENEKKIIQDFK